MTKLLNSATRSPLAPGLTRQVWISLTSIISRWPKQRKARLQRQLSELEGMGHWKNHGALFILFAPSVWVLPIAICQLLLRPAPALSCFRPQRHRSPSWRSARGETSHRLAWFLTPWRGDSRDEDRFPR